MSDRKLKLLRGCITYGHVSYDSDKPFDGPVMCDDPECVSCGDFAKAMQKASEEWANMMLESPEMRRMKETLWDVEASLLFGEDCVAMHPASETSSFAVTQSMTIDEIIEDPRFGHFTIGDINKLIRIRDGKQ